MTRRALALAAVLAALAPGAARAHEVLHQVDRSRAVAVRAYFADGQVLAYAQYEVWSPADPSIPHQKGRTDRDGWLAFVPATAGAWRVKVVDGTGHGLDVAVDVGEAAAAARSAAPLSSAAFVLRPLVGLAAIAAVFGLLFAVQRRRGAAR